MVIFMASSVFLFPINVSIEVKWLLKQDNDFSNLNQLSKTIMSTNLNENKYSIIIPTYSARLNIICSLILNLTSQTSKYLDKIYVYWNDFDTSKTIPQELIDLSVRFSGILSIIDTKTRLLTSRFLIPTSIDTQTVLSLDDDISITLEEIDRAFEIYKENNFTNQVAGPTPRKCTRNRYVYDSYRRYNVIITNIAFIHVKHMELFNDDKYQTYRQYVDEHNNCEDILINFIVSLEYQVSSVYLKINGTSVSNEGFSTQSDHTQKRINCCKYFTAEFGKRALKYNKKMF